MTISNIDIEFADPLDPYYDYDYYYNNDYYGIILSQAFSDFLFTHDYF